MKFKNIKINFSSDLKILIEELDLYFQNLVKYFTLNESWNLNNFPELEIRKCYVRGLLRYNNLTNKINLKVQSLVKEKIDTNYFKWITLPYPMIHLPNDLSESSSKLHYDQGDRNDMYTCWMPITKNEYSELNICRLENRFIDFFRKIISKFKFFNLFSISLKANVGNYYLWTGKLLHKGNLNISSKPSCALQMKLSKNEYKTERSFLIKNYIPKKIRQNETDIDFKKNYLIFKEIIKQLDNINLNDYLNSKQVLKAISKIIFENLKYKSLEISFALSILSQRFRSVNPKDWNKCFCYDLASLLIGSENLVSLDRVNKDSKKIFKDSLTYLEIKEVDDFNVLNLDIKN